VPDSDTPSMSPPYLPFKTLTNFLTKLEAEGAVPSHIDRSILSHMSGGTGSLVIHGLKALGLIEVDGAVTERFRQLALEPDRRPEIMREVLEERYPAVMEECAQNATPLRIQTAFRDMGVEGSTLRKAMSFFQGAATLAGVALPPGFKPPAARSANGSSTRSEKRRAPERPASERQESDSGDSNAGAEAVPARDEVSPPIGGSLPPSRYPPAVEGVLHALPSLDAPHWTAEKRDRFLAALTSVIDLCYAVEADRERSRQDEGA